MEKYYKLFMPNWSHPFHSWSVLNVHTTHLWCHVISVINEMNTHYTSAIRPCFSIVLILVGLFFHFMYISCIGQYVYIHNSITSTDQAIKAKQFAVNRGCILTRVAAIKGSQCYTSTHALVLSLGTYGEMLNVYFSETNKHHNIAL